MNNEKTLNNIFYTYFDENYNINNFIFYIQKFSFNNNLEKEIFECGRFYRDTELYDFFLDFSKKNIYHYNKKYCSFIKSTILHMKDEINDVSNVFYQHLLFDNYLHEENGGYVKKQIITFIDKLLLFKNYLSSLNKIIFGSSVDILNNLLKIYYLSYIFEELVNTNIDMEDKIKFLINMLDNYKSIIIMGGFSRVNYSGHTILLYIEFIENNKYNLCIFNSGNGIKYHDNNIGIKFTDITREKIINILNFNYILISVLDDENYLKYISDILQKKYDNIDNIKNIDIFYKLLYKYVNKENKIIISNEKPQLSGSCTFYSQYHFIKYYFKINNINFRDFYKLMLKKSKEIILKSNIDNKKVKLTILFLLNKDYNSSNESILNKIIEEIKKPVKINYEKAYYIPEKKKILNYYDSFNYTNIMKNNKYYNILYDIVKKYNEDNNIIFFINKILKLFIRINKKKNNSKRLFIMISYIFYLIIYNYFVINKYKININHIENIIDKINNIYIFLWNKYKNELSIANNFFITSKLIILDYCILNKYLKKTKIKYNINNFDTDTLIFTLPIFIKSDILDYLKNFDDNDIVFKILYNIKILKTSYKSLNNKESYNIKLIDFSLSHSSILNYNFNEYKQILKQYYLENPDKKIIFKKLINEYKLCKYLNIIFNNKSIIDSNNKSIIDSNNKSIIDSIKDNFNYDFTNGNYLYNKNILSNKYINYDIVKYFLRDIDIKDILLKFYNFIKKTYNINDNNIALTKFYNNLDNTYKINDYDNKILNCLYIYIIIIYKDSINKEHLKIMELIENMINKYYDIYTNSFSQILLSDKLYIIEDLLRIKISSFNEIKYIALINSINKEIIDRKHMTPITGKYKIYDIYVFNKLSIKYNYIPINKLSDIDDTYNNFNNIIHKTIRNLNDNIIYLKDFPNILLYKNILFISKKKYKIITNSTNNLINLINYNLQNGFLLKDSDNKIYFFFIINSDFVDLFNKNNYWINNNIDIEFNIESNYYLIELHYSYLFPIINEDIQIKNEKLIITFLSLVLAKNPISPLFIYNMININYINMNQNIKIFNLFNKIIDYLDHPFRFLFFVKFRNNIKNINDIDKRIKYFSFNEINYKDSYELDENDLLLTKFRNKDYSVINDINNYNNIFKSIFISEKIILLQDIYQSSYKDFYQLIYKKYLIDISKINSNNINSINKIIERIYNEDIFKRSTEDLLYEIHTRNIINRDQKDFIQIFDRDSNKVNQLIMGFGKTSVITPLIILKYYLMKTYSKFIIVLPEHLINQSYNIINSFMNVMNGFSDDYNSLLNTMNIYEENNKVYITSESNFKKNILNNIIKYNDINNIINKEDTYFIFDEIDTLINPLKSDLNIPINKKKHPESLFIYEKCINAYKTFKNNTNIFELKKNHLIDNQTNYLDYYSNNNTENNDTIVLLDKTKLNIKLDEKIKNIILKLKTLKYNKDYGFGDYINCNNKNDLIYYKNYFIAIPYTYINTPVNCSEFTDYEFSLFFTINSYIENNKLRKGDILLINHIFKESYKISKEYFNLMNYKLIQSINDNDIINNILNVDKNNEESIMDISERIYELNNIEIIYDYIEYIIYPTFFKIADYQYNISMIDILGKSFSHNKITFSGTVDFLLPKDIIEGLINKDKNTNISELTRYSLDGINYIPNNFREIFFGISKEPEIIAFNDKDIERFSLNLLFKERIILNYDSLIDVGGFFIKSKVIEIVINIYEIFNGERKIIYINENNNKMIYDGNHREYNNEINDIFIYYDHKNTVGIDFKQPFNMLGLITISEKNTLTEVS